MRASTAWLLAGAGVAAVVAHRMYRRPVEQLPSAPPPGPDPRAEELRTKLAESRAAVAEEREELEREEPATPEAEPEPAPESVEERRKRVHAKGEATARKMRKPPEPPSRP